MSKIGVGKSWEQFWKSQDIGFKSLKMSLGRTFERWSGGEGNETSKKTSQSFSEFQENIVKKEFLDSLLSKQISKESKRGKGFCLLEKIKNLWNKIFPPSQKKCNSSSSEVGIIHDLLNLDLNQKNHEEQKKEIEKILNVFAEMNEVEIELIMENKDVQPRGINQ